MNTFIRALEEKTSPSLVGTWLMSASPIMAEAACCLDFDFAVMDMEHAPIDVAQAVSILQATQNSDTDIVTRLPWNDAVLVKRMLDAGASTLMFPFIQTVDEAKAAVDAALYPIHGGSRGFAAITRASRFGTLTDYAATANHRTGIILQLETPEALDQLEAIGAIEGVDALFIGPGDMASAMGHINNPGHPDVQKLLLEAGERCRKINIPSGIVGGNVAQVEAYRKAGYRFTAIGSDIAMMLMQAKTWLSELNPHNGSSKSSTAVGAY